MNRIPDKYRNVIAMVGGDPDRSYSKAELSELLVDWIESQPDDSPLLRRIYADLEQDGLVPPYSSRSH
jgi:hypothetical protein